MAASDSENFFEKTFFNNKENLIHKWHHYFEVYERHFRPFKGVDVCFMEIGVYHGGSIQFWKNYFGKNSKIFGLDINPECKKFEHGNVKIFTGSQEDRQFLRKLRAELPPLDIVLDDGGHTMKQQIATFEEIFPHVKQDGLFVVEDIHTSYWRKYGGGYKRKGSFIEYSKNFIDYLHALYPIAQRHGLQPNEFSKSTFGLHYYPGILVIEKRTMSEPTDSMRGVPSITEPPPAKRGLLKRIRQALNSALALCAPVSPLSFQLTYQ
jgi:hypothetical protein